jgi:hypothetical protein
MNDMEPELIERIATMITSLIFLGIGFLAGYLYAKSKFKKDNEFGLDDKIG